jgi:hypothetical protein
MVSRRNYYGFLLLGSVVVACGDKAATEDCLEGFERVGDACDPVQEAPSIDSGPPSDPGDTGSVDDTAPADADAGTSDTSSPPLPPSDPGWTLGEHQPCLEPSAELSYTDVSTTLSGTEMWSGYSSVQYGPVAWLPDSSEQWAAVWHDPASIRWSMLDGSRSGEVESAGNARFIATDLDGDGAQDVVHFTRSIGVVWSLLEEEQESETLVSATAGAECGWIELVVADFNGDGLKDVFAPTSLECLDTLHPQLLLQTAPRQFDTIVETPLAWVGSTLDSEVIDLDGDGDLDIYLCNDFGPEVQPNQWLLNDGSGLFHLADDALGSAPTTFCMSASAADLNQDGVLDWVIAAIGEQFGLLRMDDVFVNHWASWGLPTLLTSEDMPWGSAATDIDNNGHTDIILSASTFSHFYDDDGEPVYAHMQMEGGVFENRSAALGLPQHANTRGVVARDVNQDGILDLLIGDYRRSPWAFVSNGCTADNWINIKAPAGTQIRVEAGEQVWGGLVTPHQGFSAFGPTELHLGLGAVETVDRVIATVPGHGEVQLNDAFQVPRQLHWSPEG